MDGKTDSNDGAGSNYNEIMIDADDENESEDGQKNENSSTNDTGPPPAKRQRQLLDNTNKIEEENVADATANASGSESDGGDSEDPTGLEGAAFQSRVPFNNMTAAEKEAFEDVATGSRQTRKVFLFLRNRLLELWLEAPLRQLTLSDAKAALQSELALTTEENTKLLERVLCFLEKHGYVNFGMFKRSELSFTRSTGSHKHRVLVLGAGMAGLTVARQLQYFGCQVTVFEPRDRVGGRVCTYRSDDYVADLGAMIVTGLGGNPLTTLAKQIEVEFHKIRPKCPMFDPNGRPLERGKDAAVEREFNRLLDVAAFLAHEKDFGGAGRCGALGQTLELLIRHQEMNCKRVQLQHQYSLLRLQERLINHIVEMEDCARIVAESREVWEKATEEAAKTGESVRTSFAVRSAHRELIGALAEFDVLKESADKVREKFLLQSSKPPSEMYMTPADRRVLDWHFANLEFANATELNKLSSKHWDQDDEHELTGAHVSIKNGYSCLPLAMSEGLDMQLNTAVLRVSYNPDGVEVVTGDPRTGAETGRVKGDMVVCTLPLGVLKSMVECADKDRESGASSRSASDSNFLSIPKRHLLPEFDPVLPEWKKEPLRRLGFGNLNKVVLCFEKYFWEQSLDTFAHIGSTKDDRGELFIFWTLGDSPVVVGMLAGKAADLSETIDDEKIVLRTLEVLRTIFGKNNVPVPVHSKVTSWRSDPWARGSYSYVAVGASGADYDLLAAPVSPAGAGPPRVFFAGEHTNRSYPATVHGAMLSGLREAGRIADHYFNMSGPADCAETDDAAAAHTDS